MSTILEQYRISDFLEWDRDKKLTLNPNFQRGNVWTPAAKSYLIDTILRGYPIPKVYLRTKIDVRTTSSIRDVVDGQQRLRAILDFSKDKFALNSRAEEFKGLLFSELGEEGQQNFLSYPISVGQLINASDEVVLEIFARLNSYSVSLNAAEKRHARFQGEFKWAVRNSTRKWAPLWEKYKVLSVRERVRMLDDSLMAELYGIILEGVSDGGQEKITKLYERLDPAFEPENEVSNRVDQVLDYFDQNLGEYLLNTPILSSPHFLMLFAALAHSIFGIPIGGLQEIPERDPLALSNLEIARNNLNVLAATIDTQNLDAIPANLKDFWKASSSTTQRITSRRIRFPIYYSALLPIQI
ncbi:MAG: DUF262 domain-containing protein [Chloroflexi bacterium]|nr:DUF262 domain-containing protein [Chloroflexota bacterium]MBI3159667.1 DUF262 domain-containing protein [Chloroflexota bacterium]